MIRHVVCFRLRSEHPEKRAADAQRLIDLLRPLRDRIPDVLSLEVGADLGTDAGHWDVVLVSGHPDADALRSYQTHPHHLEVLGIVARLVSDKAIVDMVVEDDTP